MPLLCPRRSMRHSTSEPAAPECGLARPALPLAYTCAAPASGTGHLTRSRPQDSASNAAAQEPRRPLAGTRKPRREAGDSSGARGESRLAHCRTTYKIGPLKSVAQADSAQERPQREAGARFYRVLRRCGLPPWRGNWPFGRRPPSGSAPSLGRAIVQSILVPHLMDEAGARPKPEKDEDPDK